MTAKEMFKKLKYNKAMVDDDIIIYTTKSQFGIVFYLEAKEVVVGNPKEILDFDITVGELHSHTVEEHKAITQQMKELGWL